MREKDRGAEMISFKELAHENVSVGKSSICRAMYEAGNQGKAEAVVILTQYTAGQTWRQCFCTLA